MEMYLTQILFKREYMKVKIIIMIVVLAMIGGCNKHDDANHKHEEKNEHAEKEHGHEHDHDEKKEAHENEHNDEHNDEHGDDHGDDHDHGSSKAIGVGKAIEVVDDNNGFKLSKEAQEKMKLAFFEIHQVPTVVKKEALVVTKDLVGVYRLRDSYYKFIPLKKDMKNNFILSKEEFYLGDKIVVSGLDLLSISDVYSQDKSEYGHGH